MRRAARFSLASSLLLLLTGCLHRRQAPPVAQQAPPITVRPGTQPTAPTVPTPAPGRPAGPVVQGEEGIASWYGRPFHGRRTASGEVYDMYGMTAAHRTLPFGTQVRVHDLENGRDVTVRINDRGPFVEGRIIDLSYASAQAMGMPSTALVRLEILGAGGATEEPGTFAVQIGAFQDRRNAERLKAIVEPRFGPVSIQSFDRGDSTFYRVRVGRMSSENDAIALAERLRQANMASETFVVRLD